MAQKILMNKKTIPWINNVKALCMLIVFFYHSEWYLDYRHYYIDSFYGPFFVNCFFFISGYLLFRKQLSCPLIHERIGEYVLGGGRLLLSNILFRIAIPSVLFAQIEFLPKKIIRGETIDYTDMFVETFGGCTYWFTSALVVAEVILFILLLSRNKQLHFYFICGILIACFGVCFKLDPLYILGNKHFPWYYTRGMIAVLYLALGGLYWKYEKTIDSFCNKYGNMVVLSTLLILFITFIWMVGQCESIVLKTIGKFVRDFVGILLAIRTCMIIKEYELLTFIGVNSLGFYFLCGALPNVFSIVLSRFAGVPMPLTLIIVFFLSVFVAYAIMLVLTKYLPWLFDLRLLRKTTHV